MKSREYERRRRAIEEQLQADLELIRAGYQAKLRALETVWLHSAGEDGEAPSPAGAQAGPETPRETVGGETVPGETPVGGPDRVSRRGDVQSDVEGVLPDLPELFEKRDLMQALGYEPPRSTLFRVLEVLQREKKIAIVRFSTGGTRTQYQKLAEP